MPTDNGGDAPPTAELLARLHHLVEERRRSGQYPPHLEIELNQHFERIVASHPGGPSPLRRRLDEVERASQISRDRIILTSRLPVGALAHRVVDRVVSRQTDSLLAQMNWFAGAVREALQLIADTLVDMEPQQRGTTLVDLSTRVDMVLERFAEYERAPAASTPDVRELSARLHRLESELRFARFPPQYSRVALLQSIEGDREVVRESLRPLARRLAQTAPVVVLDVGRGELLDLLAEAGVETRGADGDEQLALAAAGAGHAVQGMDPLAFLDALPEGSQGAVYAGQLPERVGHAMLAGLLESATYALEPAGQFVCRCLTPEVMSHDPARWFADPARQRPVPSGLLEFMCRQAGLTAVTVQVPSAADPYLYTLVATR